MTKLKLVELFRMYDKTLEEKGFRANSYDEALVSLEHVRWMCQKAQVHVTDGKLEKANRWLGFIQGVFWLREIFTLAEMKEHNR